ncbi:MAG: 1-acyl-sn-glycerol-3-phosphate acyltransferase [Paludibacter sp.]|jgi:1-acyl-sn-glycerol-3-phosphate acyltransferase|nr:1-acyl-sn-glycerol-3-phosphate acyltransferase [Paludibacter sp.]
MIKKISSWLLRLQSWSVKITAEEPPQSIICIAPHTSNWDFYFGTLAYWSVGRKTSFLMKKGWFFFPLCYVFSAIGGIPVDRSKKNSLTERLTGKFIRQKIVHLTIAPEGTRRRVERWHTGFYHIAYNAGIPIQLAYIDYAKKEVGILGVFRPTGNEQKDIAEIQSHYRNIVAKYPDKFVVSNQ